MIIYIVIETTVSGYENCVVFTNPEEAQKYKDNSKIGVTKTLAVRSIKVNPMFEALSSKENK